VLTHFTQNKIIVIIIVGRYYFFLYLYPFPNIPMLLVFDNWYISLTISLHQPTISSDKEVTKINFELQFY